MIGGRFSLKENHTLCVWFRKSSTIVTKNASLRARTNIGQPTKNNQHEEMLFNVI